MVQALEQLAMQGFEDGCKQLRWEASRAGTWEERARAMGMAVEARGMGAAPARLRVDQGFMRKQQRETT